MNYKYNEEEYGKLISEKGFQTNHLRYELLVFVKYLKHTGKTKKEIEKELYDFCEKYIPSFNKVLYYKIIDGAIKNGTKKKNKLIVVKSIDVLVKEVEYIDALEVDHEHKKLLLTFLVKKKISQEISKIINNNADLSVYFGGGKKKYNEAFKCANIEGKYKINDMINHLVRQGILESTSNNSGDVVLKYVKDMNEKDKRTEVYDSIKDFDNIGMLFDYYKQINNVKKCEYCGGFYKSKSNRAKYCKTCRQEIEKANATERKRKQRSKCHDLENPENR
jgi:hypothetical protein